MAVNIRYASGTHLMAEPGLAWESIILPPSRVYGNC